MGRRSRGFYTFDIETNGLWEGKPTDCNQVWCVGLLDHDTEEYTSFDCRNNFAGLEEFFYNARVLVCHNVLGFDLPVLEALLDVKPNPNCKVIDTLVWSRALYPDRTLEGGHGLEAWGVRNGIPKPEIEDWTQWSEDILHRCAQDVRNGHTTFRKLCREAKRYDSKAMLRVEQKVSEILFKQCYRGTKLDTNLAMWLVGKLEQRIAQLDEKIKPLLSARCVPVGAITKGIYKADGTYKKQVADYWEVELQNPNFSVECSGACTEKGNELEGSFQRIDFVEADIGSDKQMKEQLERIGWVPVEFTAKGNGKITEESLARLQGTAGIAEPFMSRRQASHRLSMVKGWLDKVDEDGRIRGAVNPQGAVTLRMTHRIVVNVPKFSKAEPYSEFYRKCFVASGIDSCDSWDSRVINPRTDKEEIQRVEGQMAMVGCDASGLENRMLAHHMNDPELTREITDGDFHTKVWDTIRDFVHSRQGAKNVEYALFYGAGDIKLGAMADKIIDFTEADLRNMHWSMVKSGENQGKWKKRGTKPVPFRSVVLQENGRLIRSAVMQGLPSLGELTERVQEDAENGYLTGLDGRRYLMRRGYDGKVETHKALNTLLQGDGSCVMKYAQVFLDHWLNKNKIEAYFLQTVHDELQVECRPEYRFKVAELAKRSIVRAGEYFNLNCPLDAEAQIGTNWGETH